MAQNIFESFDLETFIASYVTKKMLDSAFIGIKHAVKRINKSKSQIKIHKFDEKELEKFILNHLGENIEWASNVSFRDAINSKSTKDIFVDLNLHITPVKLRMDSMEEIPTITTNELLSDTEKNIVLLGQPGAGKTTTIKKTFIETILKEYEVYRIYTFPIIIRLKELVHEKDNLDFILFKTIFNTVGMFFTFEEYIDKIAKQSIIVHLFNELIERLDILLILDGFDEIADQNLRKEVIRNINLITNNIKNSRFILTSRSADYNLHIDNTKVYEICSLNDEQINDFVYKWLANKSKSEKFLTQLKNSPYWDTLMRPLNLAHLCALYERNLTIPSRPKSVYKKIIQLLLEDWSNQRSILRLSSYAKFEVDRKMDFLSKFAFILSVDFLKSSFDDAILDLIYSKICSDFELPESDSKDVIAEIESHNGLIIQTGSTNFEFAHKSLLEYLVADYLVKLPALPTDIDIYELIPNELAIYIAISSTPNITFFKLIYESDKKNVLSTKFLKPFCSRILIEKPDFESNILFAISISYLVNIIVKHISHLQSTLDDINKQAELYKNNEPDEIDTDVENYIPNIVFQDPQDNTLTQKINYYLECLEMILSYDKTDIYKKSLKKLPEYYTVSDIKLSKNNKLFELTSRGEIKYLKSQNKILELHGLLIEIPKDIYLLNRKDIKVS